MNEFLNAESKLTMGFRLDKDGYIIERPVINLDNETPNDIILNPPLMAFHKPRWKGLGWVEGESQSEREERESQQLLESLNPSEKELSKAERELETIDLLLEMGLI